MKKKILQIYSLIFCVFALFSSIKLMYEIIDSFKLLHEDIILILVIAIHIGAVFLILSGKLKD